jgi:hypothetical protein
MPTVAGGTAVAADFVAVGEPVVRVGPCPRAHGDGEGQDDVLTLAQTTFAGGGAHRVLAKVAAAPPLLCWPATTGVVSARHASSPLVEHGRAPSDAHP